MRLAADDALAETDPKRQSQYLRIFHDRRFPGDFRWIFPHVMDTREESLLLPGAAVSALAQIEHPDVRAFARQISEYSQYSGVAVRLLVNNYQEGDYDFVSGLTGHLENDDQRHYFGIATREFIEAHSSQQAVPLLLWLYENGPCSLCRGEVVKLLTKQGSLPEAIEQEWPYDSDNQ